MVDIEEPTWKQSIRTQLKHRDNTKGDITGVITQLDSKNIELERANQKIKQYEDFIEITTKIKSNTNDKLIQYKNELFTTQLKLTKYLDEINTLHDKYNQLIKTNQNTLFELRQTHSTIDAKNKIIHSLTQSLNTEINNNYDLYHEKMVLTLENNIMKTKYEFISNI